MQEPAIVTDLKPSGFFRRSESYSVRCFLVVQKENCLFRFGIWKERFEQLKELNTQLNNSYSESRLNYDSSIFSLIKLQHQTGQRSLLRTKYNKYIDDLEKIIALVNNGELEIDEKNTNFDAVKQVFKDLNNPSGVADERELDGRKYELEKRWRIGRQKSNRSNYLL